jgi:hypothetical protein
MKMEQTEGSEALAYKIQTPVNRPEESKQHSEHGESLKSRLYFVSPGRPVSFSLWLMFISVASPLFTFRFTLSLIHLLLNP